MRYTALMLLPRLYEMLRQYSMRFRSTVSGSATGLFLSAPRRCVAPLLRSSQFRPIALSPLSELPANGGLCWKDKPRSPQQLFPLQGVWPVWPWRFFFRRSGKVSG